MVGNHLGMAGAESWEDRAVSALIWTVSLQVSRGRKEPSIGRCQERTKEWPMDGLCLFSERSSYSHDLPGEPLSKLTGVSTHLDTTQKHKNRPLGVSAHDNQNGRFHSCCPIGVPDSPDDLLA